MNSAVMKQRAGYGGIVKRLSIWVLLAFGMLWLWGFGSLVATVGAVMMIISFVNRGEKIPLLVYVVLAVGVVGLIATGLSGFAFLETGRLVE